MAAASLATVISTEDGITLMAPIPILALAAVALLAGCTSQAALSASVTAPAIREQAHIEPMQVPVEGGMAAGLVGVPQQEPKTLLLIAHAWGGSSEEYRADLMRFAEQGVLAAAMEFRGNVADFKVATGVEDTIAAAVELQRRNPTVERTLVYGWSMGGEIALLAAMQAPPGTFDYVFAGSAVTDLESLWSANIPFRPAIEAETGGPPSDARPQYLSRSPLARADEIAGQGVMRVFLVHAAGDGAVPIEHAERLYGALVDGGQPVSFYVVTRNEAPWICVPVATLCTAGVDGGLANHEAGQLAVLEPFIQHRIEGLPDPRAAAVRGTYDAKSGAYDPSDVG